MQRVLVINGPNLNLLGQREPEIYGDTTLEELNHLAVSAGLELRLEVTTFQSNHEGAIIDRIHLARHDSDGIVINAGAFSHYSYAIHDALVASELPAIEVHISNIHARELWRRHSVTAPACSYAIYGRGVGGYSDALAKLVNDAAWPKISHRYGSDQDQVGDLRIPEGSGPHPVAVLIHGGYWRDQWTRDLMDGPAVDLTRRGIATWNIEYRRLGAGGGWPVTLSDVAQAIDAVADLAMRHPLDLDAVSVVGHSAGGHLALWAAKRPHLLTETHPAPAKVRISSVVALAPVTDLVDCFRRDLSDGAAEELLRRTPETGPERYETASPIAQIPIGVHQTLIHGTADEDVPIEMSQAYLAAATAAGDDVTYHELDGDGHMDLIDPSSAAWGLAVDGLAR